MFPASLLAKLFVKNTLKNTADGFEFKMKNIIDSGTLIGLGPLVVDETTYQPACMVVQVGDKVLRGDAITRSATLPVRAYTDINVSVEGAPLAAGSHKITVLLYTREAGRLQFTVNEPIA